MESQMQDRFEAFVTGINICYKFIQKIKTTEMTKFNLKGIHAMCIYFLQRNEDGLTAAQLSRLCSEDKAAISRGLSTLSEQGYIESGEKKYRDKIKLTQKGKELGEYVNEHIRQWVISGGNGLTEEERNTFYRVLSLISDNLRINIEQI